APHMSLYQLTIEKGTPFYSAYNRQEFSLPEEGLAADMYHLTQAIMQRAGYDTYEVSNHARPGYECRHNMAYWRYGEYLGIGHDEQGSVVINGKRQTLMKVHAPQAWLDAVEKKGHGDKQYIAMKPRKIMEEALMRGLRINECI